MITVLAIYGMTAVGKSTVASQIASMLECELRHCGDLIKDRARSLQITPSQLSLSDHHAVDADTRQIAITTRKLLVIEGRFLGYVLAGLPHVALVELTCSPDERLRRHVSRNSSAALEPLEGRDAASQELEARLYHDWPSPRGGPRFATDGKDSVQVACEIIEHFRALLPGE